MKEVDLLFPATVMPDRDWWQALWPDPQDVLRALGLDAGLTVIDLCCGDGYFTAPLAILTQGRVFAVDLNPEMLDKAKAEVDRVGATALQWICADARDLADQVTEKVDFVLIANTFHGVPDKTGLVGGVAAVLKPGGRLAIINWHRLGREKTVVMDQPRGPASEMRMSPEQVRKVVEPVGFELQRTVQLPPYHYGAIFRASGIDI